MNSELEEAYEVDDKLTEMDWDGIKTPNIKPGMFVSGWEEDADGIEEDKNPTGTAKFISTYFILTYLWTLILLYLVLIATPERELLWAANENRIDIIFKILNKQPEVVNTVDRDGYTALHKAAYNDFYELAQLLLKYKADVNAITEMKWTPLHSACKWNNAKTAALLLQHNTNINARSDGGSCNSEFKRIKIEY